MTVIKQTRILLSILIFTLTLLTSLTIVLMTDSIPIKILTPVLLLATMCYLLYLFSVGHLVVKVTGDKLEFVWRRKKLFNYSNIEPIDINEIKTLVVDQGYVLQKIITVDKIINIGTGKSEEGLKLIEFLTDRVTLRIIDSWDIWKEKGFLKVAYWINLTILILIATLAIIFILKKGFSSHLLFFVFGGLVQLYLYQGIIKSKIKN